MWIVIYVKLNISHREYFFSLSFYLFFLFMSFSLSQPILPSSCLFLLSCIFSFFSLAVFLSRSIAFLPYMNIIRFSLFVRYFSSNFSVPILNFFIFFSVGSLNFSFSFCYHIFSVFFISFLFIFHHVDSFDCIDS